MEIPITLLLKTREENTEIISDANHYLNNVPNMSESSQMMWKAEIKKASEIISEIDKALEILNDKRSVDERKKLCSHDWDNRLLCDEGIRKCVNCGYECPA